MQQGQACLVSSPSTLPLSFTSTCHSPNGPQLITATSSGYYYPANATHAAKVLSRHQSKLDLTYLSSRLQTCIHNNALKVLNNEYSHKLMRFAHLSITPSPSSQ
jgi:hypothetical protein